MIDALFGFLFASVIFTFFPDLGYRISAIVRNAWAGIRKWFGPRSDVE